MLNLRPQVGQSTKQIINSKNDISCQNVAHFGACLAQWDEQVTICCMTESGWPGFESDLHPFAACLPLSLSLCFLVSLHYVFLIKP